MARPDQSTSRPLNDKQRAFAREYLVDFNATQAAMRAGYASASAAQQASDLLRNPNIQILVEEGKAKQAQSSVLTKERLISDVWAVFQNAITKDQKNAVARLGELLCKLNGWGTQNHTLRVIRNMVDLTDAELQALIDSPEPEGSGNVRH
jgi:phage terminase small subunit